MKRANLQFYLNDPLNPAGASVAISAAIGTDEVVELTDETSITISYEGSRTQIERIKATATGGVLTITERGLTDGEDPTEDADLKLNRRPGALATVTMHPDDLIERDADETITGDWTYESDVIYNKSVRFPRYADDTARDLAIPSPSNGMRIYNTDVGLPQKYVAGAWIDDTAGGAVPNASPIVAGKKEDPNYAEHIAGTDVGGTGATMSSLPSQVARSTQEGVFIYAADAGGDDTYVVMLTPAYTQASYPVGMRLTIKVATTNTLGATLNAGTPGAKPIKTRGGVDLISGTLPVGTPFDVIFDGTNWIYQGEDIIYGLYFGDGRDGNVTISSNTTLTADKYYNNLTINNGFVLSPDGYKIYVRGTLLNNGTIRRNGNAGAQGVGSTAGGIGGAALNAGTLSDSVAGGAGGDTVNAGAPSVGTAGTAANPSYSNVNGSAGGAGGNGDNAGGAAGAAGATTRGSLYNVVYTIYDVFTNRANPASAANVGFFGAGTLYKGPAGSGGGGGGDRNGASDGGAGGGGGSAGGVIRIAARIFNNAGVIESIGGAGGAGRNSGGSNGGGGGGGGGGAGGVIYLIYSTLTALGTCTVTGGALGAKGTKTGTGIDGVDGTVGSTGIVIQIVI